MKTLLIILVFLQGVESASAYNIKTFTVEGYSKPWIAVSADSLKIQETKAARIHFLGWTQDSKTGAAYSKYDFSWKDGSKTPDEPTLRKFIEVYGIQNDLIKNPDRIILIPLARGHCDQYPELYDASKFDGIFSRVLQGLNIKEENFKVEKMSAHSGGGKVLSQLLMKASNGKFLKQVSKVDFYDALYWEESLGYIRLWLTANSPVSLRLFSIPGGTPDLLGVKFYKLMTGTETTTNSNTGDLAFEELSKTTAQGNRVAVIQEQAGKLDHWTLVKAAWTFQ